MCSFTFQKNAVCYINRYKCCRDTKRVRGGGKFGGQIGPRMICGKDWKRVKEERREGGHENVPSLISSHVGGPGGHCVMRNKLGTEKQILMTLLVCELQQKLII